MEINPSQLFMLSQLQRTHSAWQIGKITDANDAMDFIQIFQSLLGSQGDLGSMTLKRGEESLLSRNSLTVLNHRPIMSSSNFTYPSGNSPYEDLIQLNSQKYGVAPDLIREVMRAESGFNASAQSPAGAMGLMQLMPGTAQSYGADNAFDPAQNIDAGVHFLKDLLTRFNGNVTYALAGYNAGPGAVEKYQGVPPFEETRSYVSKISMALQNIHE